MNYLACYLLVFILNGLLPSSFGFSRGRPSSSRPRNCLYASSKTTSIDVSKLEDRLQSCRSSREADRILKEMLSVEAGVSFYNSVSIPAGASTRGISDGDLAIQTRLANKKYSIMDVIELSGDRDADRASLAAVCLFMASTTSAIVANQNMPGPEILRFIVVWLLSFAPLAFTGYGIATPDKLQTSLVSIQRTLFPTYRRRMLQHEAGHALMAHLVGYPIAGYRANAVKNAVELYPLQDVSRGEDMVRLLGFDQGRREQAIGGGEAVKAGDVPFFSDQGRGALLIEEQSVFRNNKNYTNNPALRLPSVDEPCGAWPYRGFDEVTLDKLTVVALGGVCAEILAFGNAEGGLADISLLKQILLSAEEEMSERDIYNRIRYGLAFTMTQLRRHLGALDAVAMTMENDGSVAQCVAAIETCVNPSGQDGIMGDYELRRRQRFRTENSGWLERILLGEVRDIDTDAEGMVQGKGGGYRKETFRLTGDDPLHAALVVTLAFLVWASSGGLSLH
jgi:hypothetical protein